MAYCMYWSQVADGVICHAAMEPIRQLGEGIRGKKESEKESVMFSYSSIQYMCPIGATIMGV